MLLREMALSGSKRGIVLTSTGNGTGVAALRIRVSNTMTVSLTEAGRFYSDAGGTADESTTWTITAGALRTIYLKVPAGKSSLIITKKEWVTEIGSALGDGWKSETNAPSIVITPNEFKYLISIRVDGNVTILKEIPASVVFFRIQGFNSFWSYIGELHSKLDYIWIVSNTVKYECSTFLPSTLTTVVLIGNLINFTGLNLSGAGNIATFTMTNFRITKMSDAELIALLTSLQNRVGNLPATVLIGDYANYASPPAEVVAAVDSLKAAKSITTLTLSI